MLLCGVVFIIVGVVFLIVWGLFFIVIFVWLFKFNDIVWDKFGEVGGWNFIGCCLYQFVIGALDKGLLDLSVSHFVCPSF